MKNPLVQNYFNKGKALYSHRKKVRKIDPLKIYGEMIDAARNTGPGSG